MVRIPVYAILHISSKKLYLDRRGTCGGGQLVGIFFLFYFAVFDFLKLFCVLENDLYGRVMAHDPPLQIICRGDYITRQYKSNF